MPKQAGETAAADGWRARLAHAANKAAKAWPALPFMSYGMWMAWAALTYSGSLWLSDTEVNGYTLSTLYVYATIAGGLTLVALALLARRGAARIASDDRIVVFGACLAAAACLGIILVGPHYLGPYVFGAHRELFRFFAVLVGVGTGCLGMRCGTLFCRLPPRHALVYAGAAQLATAFVYFAVLCGPQVTIVEHGPSLVDIVAFTGLPLVAAALSCIRPTSFAPGEIDSGAERDAGFSNLTRSFWRFVVFAFGISLVVSVMRSQMVSQVPPSATVEVNNAVMHLRVFMAFGFMLYGVTAGLKGSGLGRVCSLAAIASAVVAAAASAIGTLTGGMVVVAQFSIELFKFMMLCIIAFISAQGRTSPVVVFGIGYGLFMVGSGIGWAIGLFALPAVPTGVPLQVFYLVCAGVMLLLAIGLFSERDYARLFSAEGYGILEMGDQFDAQEPAGLQSSDAKPVRRGRFFEVTELLGNEANLSARELEVFRYIAKGYSSERIADEIKIAVNTVRAHTRNVYVKLDVHSRDEIMRLVDEEIARVA